MSEEHNFPYDPLVVALQSVAAPATRDIRVANGIRYVVDETDGCIYLENASIADNEE